MGGLQSKKRLNKSDSCTQTPIFGRYSVKGERNLGRCSTFSTPVSASPCGAAAAIRVLSGKPAQPRLNKRPKYDPVYVLWKNAFEDRKTRTPRKVSPIREESQLSQNITDAVAGQLTPKGFPSYTHLKKTINRNNETSYEDNQEKSLLKVRRRLSMRRRAPYEKTIHKSAEAFEAPTLQSAPATNDDTIENSYASVFSNCNDVSGGNGLAVFDRCGVKKAENTETTVGEASSKLKPHFLSKIPAERAIIVEKLMTEIKQRSAEKCEQKKINITLSSKRSSQPTTERSPTLGRHSPDFLKKLTNPQAEIIEKIYMGTEDWKAPYTIRKGYYYL